MSTADGVTSPPGGGALAAGPANRSGAKTVVTVLAFLNLTLLAVQFALAAYGSFGGGYAAHGVVGRAMTVVAVLMLIAVIIAKCGPKFIVVNVVLALLSGPAAIMLAGAADDGNATVGSLHGLNAVIIAVLSGMMTRAARPRSLSS